MSRPPGKTDYNRRLKAFELYAAGVSKSDIARELNVTRPCVGHWATKDKWEDRLAGIVNRAEEAINATVGNEIADTLLKLRSQMAQRIRELEQLCQPSNSPNARLQAIKLWLTLAGIGNRGIPNPTDPTTPKSLELIEDLLHGSKQLSSSPGRPDSSSGNNHALADSGTADPGPDSADSVSDVR